MSHNPESLMNLMRLKAFCIDGDKYTAKHNRDNLDTYPDNVIDEYCEAHINEVGDDDVIFITNVEPFETMGSITFRKLNDWITWIYPQE